MNRFSKNFKNVWKYLKKYWYLELLALAFTIIATLSNIRYSWLIKNLIDDVLVPKKLEKLLPLSLLFAGLVLFTVLTNLVKSYLFERVAQSVIADIRSQLLIHILRLPHSFFSKITTGEIISRVISDVENIQQMVSNALVDLATSFITIIGVLLWLLLVDWKLTLITLAVVPIFILISRVMGARLSYVSKKIQEQRADITGTIHEAISGIDIVKAFSLENIINKAFIIKIKLLAKLIVSRNVQGVFANTLWQSVLIPYQAIIFGVGGYWYITKGSPTIGTLFAFLNYMNIIIPATMTLINILMQISQSSASFDRIFEYLSFSTEGSGNKMLSEGAPVPLSYRNVSFSYGESNYSLKDINLDIKPGEIIALVGPTGAGKTTLSKLLLRFYEPHEGKIIIGNTDIREFNLESLRKQIGVVPQETFLFNTTIKENLLYANPSATIEDIIAAAKKAQIHNHIMSLPEKYETVIGERGVKLSGGEKQRLSIARALLKNPQILIMDEPTSSLDALTESTLWETINDYFKGKTIIVIAHRLSTVRKADKIIVIDKGMIVETGKYKELLDKNGLFSKLHHSQFQTQEEDKLVEKVLT